MIGFSIVTGLLFYRHFMGVFLVLFFSVFTIRKRVEELEENDKTNKMNAFVDFLSVLRRLSHSGMSLPLCFQKSEEELKTLYPDDNAWIIKSIKSINRKISLDPHPGPYLVEWGQRDKIKEIEDLGQILEVIQGYGGNVSSAIVESTNIISERLATEKHVKLLATSKVFEQKVLYYLGYVMIIVLYKSMPDMFEVLFTTFMGRIVMTFSLLIMILGKQLGLKLSRIEV